MWWRIEKADEEFAPNFAAGFWAKNLAYDFATRCDLAPRFFIAAAKHFIHSGLSPTTITADFALGKTVS
jgi:hypothetical protein